MKIAFLNINRLRGNKLTKIFPEFYELKNVIENNDWHHNDSVFNHTIKVLISMEKLLKKCNYKINKYLNKKLNNHSRKQLLFLGAMLHDIGKKETIVVKDNVTYCPQHEIKGIRKAHKILRYFNLSAQEEKFVINLIQNHTEAHNMPDMNNKSFGNFKMRHKDYFIELVLLVVADQMGSDLRKKYPKEFKIRMNFYNTLLINVYKKFL